MAERVPIMIPEQQRLLLSPSVRKSIAIGSGIRRCWPCSLGSVQGWRNSPHVPLKSGLVGDQWDEYPMQTRIPTVKLVTANKTLTYKNILSRVFKTLCNLSLGLQNNQSKSRLWSRRRAKEDEVVWRGRGRPFSFNTGWPRYGEMGWGWKLRSRSPCLGIYRALLGRPQE